MKKLQTSKFNRLLKQVNRRLFPFGLTVLLITTLFYSCSSDEESINKAGMSKTSTQTAKAKTIDESEISVKENLDSFSQQIFGNVKSLEVALNKNSYVGFNTQAMQKFNAAKNENDLKIVFEMAGIANSQEIINILKNNVAIQQTFISKNASFYTLTGEKQVQLLNTSLELTKISYKSPILPPAGLVGAPSCGGTFNKSVDRCAGDFGTCAVFAVAGAYAGLAPGLLAAAYCMVTKISCDNRAKEDYKECIHAYIPDGYVPPTGVLTLKCDLDSCWTVDSNGKYIETKRKWDNNLEDL